MTCIEGWWNWYDGTPAFPDEIWMYYADYVNCDTEDESLSSCGGQRGMTLFQGTGNDGYVMPGTHNPFYGQELPMAIEVRMSMTGINNSETYVKVRVYAHSGAYASNSGPITLLGTGVIFGAVDQCQEIAIPIFTEEAMTALASEEYLHFEIEPSNTPGFGPPESTPHESPTRYVIDNLEWCPLLDIQIAQPDCDSLLCAEITLGCSVECTTERNGVCDSLGCCVAILWSDTITEYEYCEVPLSTGQSCCFEPPSAGIYSLEVNVQYQVNGQYLSFSREIEIEYSPCKDVTIDGQETWSSAFPEWQTFDQVVVEPGARLTIEAGIFVRFCEEGRLTIEPGGEVVLYGTLTSGCGVGWEGVEVQGNGSASQFPVNGVYPQGRLICQPGSVIEHAEIAAKLFGPTRADAGGQLQAVGTTFRNNSRAIEFAAYQNYFVTPSKQRPYFSKIRDCAFVWNDDYQIGLPTRQHIKMDGVFGVGIYGCAFTNTRNLTPSYNPKEYGVGISSTDSHFTVGSSSTPSAEPCPMPCSVINSTFTGLGKGIEVARVMRNMPFAVYSSRFEEVFYGIMVSGVHGADIMHNEFRYGQVQPISGDRDQVGIYFAAPQQFGSVQENTFERTAGNAGRAYGIVCDETGPYANVIRKNSFEGMFLANQAFRSNAAGNNYEDPGLRYLCNENDNPNGRDFHVAEVEGNGMDRIQVSQGYFPGVDVQMSSANTFSEDALDGDGHFGNYGAFQVEYYYDPNALEEVPDVEKIVSVIRFEADENTCGEQNCDGLPCIDGGILADIKDDFATHSDSLAVLLLVSDTIGVVYHKARQFDALRTILRRYEVDTSAYVRDSLIVWYKAGPDVPGKFLVYGLLAYADSTTYVLNQLSSMSQDTALAEADRDDARRVHFMYSLLSTKSIEQFDGEEVDSLFVYARIGGTAMGVSHGLLMRSDTFVAPMYFVPGELAPRTEARPENDRATGILPVIFPNPTTGSIFIRQPANQVIPVDRIDVMDGLGRVVVSQIVNDGGVWPIEVRLPDTATGIYVVRMSRAGEVVASELFSKL